MHQREIDGFMRALAPVMGAFVKDAVGVLMQPMLEANQRMAGELQALKEAQAAQPKAVDEATVLRLAGEVLSGMPQPEPAKGVTVDDLRPLLQDMVDAIPPAKDGESVTIEQLAPLVEEIVARHVAALPPAEPGKSVTVEDVAPMIGDAVAAHNAAMAIYEGRRLAMGL